MRACTKVVLGRGGSEGGTKGRRGCLLFTLLASDPKVRKMQLRKMGGCAHDAERKVKEAEEGEEEEEAKEEKENKEKGGEGMHVWKMDAGRCPCE